jgi:hypothetical protein
LRKEKSLLLLNKILNEKMNGLQERKSSDLSRQSEQIEEVMKLLDLAKHWDFEISLEEPQNLISHRLRECFEELEKCWWGDGVSRPFPTNLITLAEKLGFNVEKYSKISVPGIKS